MESSKYIFKKLTPINDADLKIYEDALNFVFQENDLKNVAITGPYSAGKSSVLETYKARQPDKRFLNISLAHFDSGSHELDSQEDRDNNGTVKGIQNHDAVLEGKILNQLIHQINPNDIPQTHFKVKKKLSKFKMFLTTVLFAFVIILLLYMVRFTDWRHFVLNSSDTWLKNFLTFTTNDTTVVIGGIICVSIFMYLLFMTIQMIRYNKFLFKKLKIQGNEIEIFEEANESYFDKYLNEVLYLFENANAEVIVFEDMDRFDSNQIFQKLREINWLINKKSNQVIRFFYLLRDDTFSSKDRTKFFDFIIPIVPIVDGSNSYDQFISHFKEGRILDKFDRQFLQGLSLYIDDMRILKNIYNEYLIYHDRIQTTELNNDKLLAIIAYKNIFPRDFSQLQLGAGFVHNLFFNKSTFISSEVQKHELKIQEKKTRIKDAENELCNEIDELDAIYFTHSQALEVNNKRESQFNSRADFIREMKNNPENVYYRNYHGQQYDLDFQKEYEKLSQSPDYARRKSNIENKSSTVIEELKSEISRLIEIKSKLESKKLHEIINKRNIDEIFSITFTNEIGEKFLFNDVKSSPYFFLIKFLIRNGYIDETYSDYMTYFYEHSLSRVDKIFLRSVTDEDAKEFSYKLKDHALVVSRLREIDYDREEILNFGLLGYLLKTQNPHLTRILTQLKKKKRLDFISQFWATSEEKRSFVVELNKTWPGIFKEILNSDYFSEYQKQQYALDTIHYSSMEIIDELNNEECMTRYISNNKEFLNVPEPEIDKIISSLQLLNVKFNQINFSKANSLLFMEAYKADLYEINIFMVSLILNKVYALQENDDYIHKNYTLLVSRPQESIVKYVKANISDYLELILKNCNLKITDELFAALEIINNPEINIEYRITYIKYLQTEIEKLDSINDEELWPALLQFGNLRYSEFNILQYYYKSGNGLDDILINFINSNPTDLRINYEILCEDFGQEKADAFIDDIIQCDKLINEKYESLVKEFGTYYESFTFESIPDNMIRLLIMHGLIMMNETNLQFFRENYIGSQVEHFILINIETYTNEVINQDNFIVSEIISLIDKEISDTHKIKLIELISDPISISGKRYSEAVKSHILKHNFNIEDLNDLIMNYDISSPSLKRLIISIFSDHVDQITTKGFDVSFSLLKELLQMDEMVRGDKSKLFISLLSKLNERQVYDCLEILERADLLGLFSGKRPKLEQTEENYKILTIFQNKKWISGFDVEKTDPNYYRAIGRKTAIK
ncbi:hypothetical protein [Paenibacillus woosongensis]|uniref:YobI-like P-loop NTPase domain-containing protein n=1 Tax=Paenibacillus woosongensis TaxID=307580 RepID=A0A7X2Z3Y3_9BACL|nr:hypothetical protein [Paenibacillus woosongensis]MUG46309.1 hypothetical protein [Paenibacillus woosongensis]